MLFINTSHRYKNNKPNFGQDRRVIRQKGEPSKTKSINIINQTFIPHRQRFRSENQKQMIQHSDNNKAGAVKNTSVMHSNERVLGTSFSVVSSPEPSQY